MTLSIEDQNLFYANPKEFYKRYYKIEPNTGCWLWVGALSSNGYGSIRRNYKSDAAHRVIYKLYKTDIELGECLDHICNTRACVNPEHLIPTSHKLNVRRGKRAKINKEIAESIKIEYKKNGVNQAMLAEKYEVSDSVISGIITGVNWDE